MDCAHVISVVGVGSGMSVAITDDGGDYGAVIVSGANTRIDVSRLRDAALWANASILLLQNEVPEPINVMAAQAARARGIAVWLNAAPARPLTADLEQALDGLVVNAIEAEQMCGIVVTDLSSAEQAAERLVSRFRSVVVTSGGAGVVGFERGGEPICIAALPVAVVSTHGAGDAFVGTLVAALAAGRGFASGLAAANGAAARHVSTRAT